MRLCVRMSNDVQFATESLKSSKNSADLLVYYLCIILGLYAVKPCTMSACRPAACGRLACRDHKPQDCTGTSTPSRIRQCPSTGTSQRSGVPVVFIFYSGGRLPNRGSSVRGPPDFCLGPEVLGCILAPPRHGRESSAL